MKKIIITGASSFIGYRLCRTLAQKDYEVYAVIRKGNAKKEALLEDKNINIVYSSMENYEKLDELIHEPCDVGITLAWNGTRGADRNNEKMQKENFLFSLDCVEAFSRLGCKKILTAGSQAEYGPWFEKRKITENDECNPNTEYGKYKLAFYKKALEVCTEKKITLIEPRFFSLYGDDDNEKTMIISMVRNMLQNEPCELTECKQLWDFLYVDDAVNALCNLIESKNAKGVYNFGSGISKPLKEYVIEMAKLTHTNSKLNFGAVPYPKTGIVNTNPSIKKLKKEIKWKPNITFDKGIEKVIAKQSNYKCEELEALDKSAYSSEIHPLFSECKNAIVFEVSGIYVPYLDVAIRSLVANTSEKNVYDIIVLTKEIDSSDCDLLIKQVSDYKNISLRFFDPSKFVRKYIEKSKYKYLYLNYYRLALPWILNEYEKILNLGVDIVIQKDVAELLNCNMSESEYIAGAIDLGYIGRLKMDIPKSELGLKNPDGYVNADVLILNNKNIRRDFSEDYVMNIWQKYQLRCAEQDAFNMLFDGHIHYVDLRWNLFPKKMASTVHIAHNSDSNIQLWQESLKDPYIIHFAAYPKAWDFPAVGFGDKWWFYARKSPYYEELLRRMCLSNEKSMNETPRLTIIQKVSRKLLPIFPKGNWFRKICKKIYHKISIHSKEEVFGKTKKD